MHQWTKQTTTFFILLYLATSALAGATAGDIEKKVDEYLGAYQKMDRFAGSVLIAQQGKVLVRKGFGMANCEHAVPNTAQTTFRIASLTKQFTATAIMMLQEQKLLNVHDTIEKFIPDYPHGDKIKLVHLLTHTSGIPDHAELPDFNRDRRVYPTKTEETISKFKDLPLEFTPGEKFSYSNSGYILLGVVIEKASGMPFQNFIEQKIMQPLGMEHSGFELVNACIPGMATGYTFANGQIMHADYRNITNAGASGALYSTVEDMYLWDRALYTEKLISRGAMQKMLTPFTENYGYGWGLVNIFGRKMAAHNGETEGFRTNITRFVDDEVCIIILSNLEQTPVGKMSVDLAAMVFGEPYTVPEIKESVSVNPAVFDDYVGKYQVQEGFYFNISRESDQLYCQATGQEKLEIYPESESDFFLKAVEARLSFKRGKDGSVEKLILYQGGHEVPAPKVE